MGVGGCRPGRLVFFRSKQLLQVCCDSIPFPPSAVSVVKDSGERSPTGISHKDGFFFFTGIAILRFKVFYEPDRLDISMSFFTKASCSHMMRFGYSEVSGRG